MTESVLTPVIPIDPVSPVLWAALGKVAGKEADRDGLEAGSRHEVSLHVSGDVDGRRIHQRIEAILSVGHDQQKATSVTPEQPKLIAAILSKLNAATRERILNDLPEEFEAEGQLPELDKELVVAAGAMLKRLRASKQITANGPVRCEYTVESTGGDRPAPAAACPCVAAA